MTPDLSVFQGLVRRLLLPAVALLGCAGTSHGQSVLAANSPFGQAIGTAGAAKAPAEDYELEGSSSQGADVTVCIFERQAKHSQWIPIGGDVDGIRVVSFDPLNDKAVVVIAGSKKELSMRKSAVTIPGPAPASQVAAIPEAQPPAPIASAPPAVAGSPAQEQREARMLVSDLLEIGIQQRKAYQEARQKAASGTPAPPEN
jgi:hypothetical protein